MEITIPIYKDKWTRKYRDCHLSTKMTISTAYAPEVYLKYSILWSEEGYTKKKSYAFFVSCPTKGEIKLVSSSQVARAFTEEFLKILNYNPFVGEDDQVFPVFARLKACFDKQGKIKNLRLYDPIPEIQEDISYHLNAIKDMLEAFYEKLPLLLNAKKGEPFPYGIG